VDGSAGLSVLDDADAIGAGDPSGALRAIAGWPSQVADALEAVAAADLEHASPTSVLFCGMGGSAVGGDVLAAVARDHGRAPVVVQRSYGAPAWCGPDTFVIASSYSGETVETLDAFRAARDQGARGIAVTSGGTLAQEARRAGWPVIGPDAGLMPRYALGWLVTAPVAAAVRARLLDLPGGWADGLAAHLADGVRRWGPEAIAQDNVAKSLAHELVGALPVVWGGDGVSAAAAYRWKTELNENAKVPAVAASLPELDHNEIVAWAPEGAQGRPVPKRVLVLLREAGESERIAARFDSTAAEVSASFDLVYTATGHGPQPLGPFFELALLGGFVSVYLAILRGVDPTPIESISRLRAALAHLG